MDVRPPWGFLAACRCGRIAAAPTKSSGEREWIWGYRHARPNRNRRGGIRRNALSSAFARTVSRAGRYCDGNGLYLEVKPSGTRSWIQRLVIRGRRRELGLGAFPLVSLKEARARALANRQAARTGGDPLAEKQRASA